MFRVHHVDKTHQDRQPLELRQRVHDWFDRLNKAGFKGDRHEAMKKAHIRTGRVTTRELVKLGNGRSVLRPVSVRCTEKSCPHFE